MLRGIFSAKGVPPLEFKHACAMVALLLQHAEAPEQEADGGSFVVRGNADVKHGTASENRSRHDPLVRERRFADT